jgi:phosphoribosylglycinamide formyltransferase-1
MAKLKIAVLISGRGSNLQALIDACREPDYPAEIGLVLSNVEGAAGLDRARRADLPTCVIDHKDFGDRNDFEEALLGELGRAGVGLVCLAGFMRLLGDHFLRPWHNRVVNIHPSLLPSFKGVHVHEQVIESGARLSGCTVHFVRPAMDNGPIIIQAAVPVLPDDGPETLAARVLKQEHRIYPMAVRYIAEGRLRIVAERVIIDGALGEDAALCNPSE